MSVIAWAYMVELESGMTNTQVKELIDKIPENVKVFPFNLEDGKAELCSTSMALGFLDNDYFEYLDSVRETLAEICNDWAKENASKVYPIIGKSPLKATDLKVILL